MADPIDAGNKPTRQWAPDIAQSGKPHYIAIADAIADGIKLGQLVGSEKLPPQRRLAQTLGIDFTTVARGYVEAQKRGLIDCKVGQGSFVRADAQTETARRPRRAQIVDLSMNLPPEPDDPALLARMQAGLVDIGRDLVGLLRYQGCGGAPPDKDAALMWLGRRGLVPTQDRLLIVPGAHAALMGIFNVLAKPGDTFLSEVVTYPGARSIAAQLGLRLVGLRMDNDGIDPDAFAHACEKHAPKALYLNPTLQNPTTITISPARRMGIAAVARRFQVPIVEDDSYGFIPARTHPPLAAILPDLTWHVAGLAKCIGAGIRAAYVVVPNARDAWSFAAAIRCANVMASPLTVALATRWIEDGTADAILRFIRTETAARQSMASAILSPGSFKSADLSFNLWLHLPAAWTRSAFVAHVQGSGIGVVASDAFTVEGTPAEAVRVCLGGPATRATLRGALEFMARALRESPAIASPLY
jgi:DNA-binding transcriptional MocR family regulator